MNQNWNFPLILALIVFQFVEGKTYPEDCQDDSADFFLLGVGQDVGQNGNNSEPKEKKYFCSISNNLSDKMSKTIWINFKPKVKNKALKNKYFGQNFGQNVEQKVDRNGIPYLKRKKQTLLKHFNVFSNFFSTFKNFNI